MSHETVYYWYGGTEEGRWLELTGTGSTIDARVDAVETCGMVAVKGDRRVGPPEGPPSREALRRVGFLD